MNTNINNAEKTILSLIGNDNRITMADMSKMLNINLSAVQRKIELLQDAEILKREGSKSRGKWVINESYFRI